MLDEADRMLDMGFIRDIRKVLALLPKKRQNLLFSATFSDEIRELTRGLLHDPATVEVAPRNTTAERVEQAAYMVGQKHKRELLAHLIKEKQWFQALVFTRTKHGANKLAEYLTKHDIPATAIHGNKSQAARTRALAQFKDGSLPVLVATDIAARGLDIDQLPQVVNFELPSVAEDYVHRIGRTGRAGAAGHAISLVDREEVKLLTAIERLIKRQIERAEAPGFVPSAGGEAAHDADHQRDPMPRRGGGRNTQGRPQPTATPTRSADRPAGGGRSSSNPGKPGARPAQRPRTEADGNRAPRQGDAREVDGNRAHQSRTQEVDGNRVNSSQRAEVDGNRAPANRRPEGAGNRSGQSQNRRPAPRAALFSSKPGGSGGER